MRYMSKLVIPIGEENFELFRQCGGYYVDKTKFIVELLQDNFKANLITRPRRFGKTLAMSMLKNFFDIRKDSKPIFEGLEITKYEELCKEWMNQWPVLFLSLKDVANNTFQGAYDQLVYSISNLCVEHSYLLESDKVDESDRNRFQRLKDGEATGVEVRNSLYMLTRMLYMHYGKPVILLIDEYDVPLAKGSEYGYYNEILDVIRNLMSTSFKTNDFLKFAVVTGCLRIAKESIFTGTNHFKSNSIAGKYYLDSFGFTQDEVEQLLKAAGMSSKNKEVKDWYDGYHFGENDVYCPWDVLNYVCDLGVDPEMTPISYWKDTSHNDIIRRFIGKERMAVNEKFETLLAGGYVKVEISEDSTYDFDGASESDFWGILYLTGYLTPDREAEKAEKPENGEVCLRIPNKEVRTIFGDTIVEWFRESMPVKAEERRDMFAAWWNGEEKAVTEAVSEILSDSISYYDYKEDYYHAFVAGLFSGAGYLVNSNAENGLGRSDVVIKDRKTRNVIIVEVKRSISEEQMEKDCREALQQIDLKQYAKKFLKGYKTVLCYGAAFYDKDCLIRKVMLEGMGQGSVYEIE